MAIVQNEDISICDCTTTSGYCCEGETDLLATSVYYLAGALKAYNSALDYTDPKVLEALYREYASFLSDTKAAAYSMQLSRCLAGDFDASVESDYSAAKAAAKGFQSRFSIRDLTMIQGILMWLILKECVCRGRV